LGAGFNLIEVTSTRHAFSLSDPSISYPYRADTVSVQVLVAVTVLAPGITTALVSLLVPLPSNPRTSRSLIIRRKLWEWNTAWMGLGLALASAFMITEGLKDVAGKPRPHLLDLCDADTSPESIRRWRVGGLGPDELTTSIPILVTWQICRTAGSDALHNAFASWPSGHSSFSFAGMLYLTLFLSAKLGVHIPVLLPSTSSRYISTFDEEPDRPSSTTEDPRHDSHYRDPRNRAAAPPVYLLLISIVPVGAASYIAVSRWFDYRHHGIDILTGSLIGAFCAYFAFRLYHLPIRRGAGWSWGARSRERAFWLGIGTPNYVGDEGWQSAAHSRRMRQDLENGRGGEGVEMKNVPKPERGPSPPKFHNGPGYGRSISDNRISTRSDEGYLLESDRLSDDWAIGNREPRGVRMV
jgi:membrane-associated phospholipid phosphatase